MISNEKQIENSKANEFAFRRGYHHAALEAWHAITSPLFLNDRNSLVKSLDAWVDAVESWRFDNNLNSASTAFDLIAYGSALPPSVTPRSELDSIRDDADIARVERLVRTILDIARMSDRQIERVLGSVIADRQLDIDMASANDFTDGRDLLAGVTRSAEKRYRRAAFSPGAGGLA